MLLLRVIGPVNHTPCGTTSLPPPFFSSASMALAKASVQSEDPSPLAPKSFRLTSLSGNTGAVTCSILKGRFSYRQLYLSVPVALAPSVSRHAHTKKKIFLIYFYWFKLVDSCSFIIAGTAAGAISPLHSRHILLRFSRISCGSSRRACAGR